MKQEILFVLLKDFADWEGAYIAPYLNYGCGPDIESKYVVKTVSVTKASRCVMRWVHGIAQLQHR